MFIIYIRFYHFLTFFCIEVFVDVSSLKLGCLFICSNIINTMLHDSDSGCTRDYRKLMINEYCRKFMIHIFDSIKETVEAGCVDCDSISGRKDVSGGWEEKKKGMAVWKEKKNVRWKTDGKKKKKSTWSLLVSVLFVWFFFSFIYSFLLRVCIYIYVYIYIYIYIYI